MKKLIYTICFALVAIAFTNVAVASNTGEHKASKTESVQTDGVAVELNVISTVDYFSPLEDVSAYSYNAIDKAVAKNCIDRSTSKDYSLIILDKDRPLIHLYITNSQENFTSLNHNFRHNRTKDIYHSCMKFC